jgi:hypothetical protein
MNHTIEVVAKPDIRAEFFIVTSKLKSRRHLWQNVVIKTTQTFKRPDCEYYTTYWLVATWHVIQDELIPDLAKEGTHAEAEEADSHLWNG